MAKRLEIDAAKKVVSDLEQQWDDAATLLVNEKLGTQHESDALYFGGHECHKSPSSRCVYNADEDRNHDFCLFCEYPEDRG
jgi:hypothetical protein